MKHLTKPLLILTLIGLFTLSLGTVKAQPVRGAYVYKLSNFTGSIPYGWSRVVSDRERNEIYVLFQNTIRVFNESGMEIYRFGDDLDLGHIVDVTVDKNGDILLLAYEQSEGQPVGRIIQCNYRGEPKSDIKLKNLPSQFSKFLPNRMICQGGDLYLASFMGLNIVVTDYQGNFKKGYDLLPLLELEEKDRGNLEILGFSVDREGNILFTVPTLFRACILSPDGKFNWFGKPGSAAGRFNIPAGIVRDSKGNYLVVDKLRCTVMVFDKDFKFLSQFSERGYKSGYLIAPDEIAIDNGDRIYVTQVVRKGVSVFKLTY